MSSSSLIFVVFVLNSYFFHTVLADTTRVAKIEVMHNDKKILTSDRGEYWRLLLPGMYVIRAKSCKSGQCWASPFKKVEVKRNEVTILNFRL